MGSVRITETTYVGDSSSSVEYEFSDSVDFLAWESDKQERLTNALKGLYGGLGSQYFDPPEELEPMVADVQVTKKKTDTKH